MVIKDAEDPRDDVSEEMDVRLGEASCVGTISCSGSVSVSVSSEVTLVSVSSGLGVSFS